MSSNIQLLLPKKERLRSKKIITSIFKNRKSLKEYPFVIFYQFFNNENWNSPVKFMPSVAKKRIKKAVDRNKIKRLIKEAYRLNKSTVISETNKKGIQIALVFVYLGDENNNFSFIENKIKKALYRFNNEILIEK